MKNNFSLGFICSLVLLVLLNSCTYMYDTFVPYTYPADMQLYDRPLIIVNVTRLSGFEEDLSWLKLADIKPTLPLVYEWPDTPEAKKILHDWWQKSGRHSGTADLFRCISSSYPMDMMDYRVCLAPKWKDVGLDLNSSFIACSLQKVRALNKYDAAFFRYILDIIETTLPLPFEEGKKRWKQIRDYSTLSIPKT